MRQKLRRRLEDLEKIADTAAARRTERARDSESAVANVRAILKANDFPSEPTESLAKTFARFLGMSPREPDHELRERACSDRRAAVA
jgi:hypothetical protein